jgi:hypothetical protein
VRHRGGLQGSRVGGCDRRQGGMRRMCSAAC